MDIIGTVLEEESDGIDSKADKKSFVFEPQGFAETMTNNVGEFERVP